MKIGNARHNELEETLPLLHSEKRKEIEPSRQNSTYHRLIVSNPIDKKASEFTCRNMLWEAPSIPMSANDSHLIAKQEKPLMIG